MMMNLFAQFCGGLGAQLLLGDRLSMVEYNPELDIVSPAAPPPFCLPLLYVVESGKA